MLGICKGSRIMRSSFIILAASLLFSCGGDGGGDSATPAVLTSPPPTLSVGGIWDGTFNSNVVAFNSHMIGIVSEDREVRFISDDGVQIFGDLSVIGNTVSGSLTSIAPFGYFFVDGSQLGIINVQGTVTEKQYIGGEYSGTGDQGSIGLSYDSLYDRDSALTLLEGTWNLDYLDNQYINLNLNVQSDGTFTGSDNRGYSFEGDITIINPEYNCYRVSVTVTVPGNDAFVYSGLSALGDHSGTNDLLYFAVDYENNESIAGTFMKQ